jgi:peptide-methionine (R)-S-oxide reductase
MIDRRQLLIKAAGSALLINAAAEASAFAASTSGERFEVTLSDAEWRKRLTPAQYAVLRDQSTERAGTSPLDREKRRGVFVCAGCNLDLYRSEDKFDSGTGWPSFVRPIKNAVRTSIDRSLFSVRIEVHCRRCGGHLGHVFDDGPAPTGKRYCMNGIAMKFRPV